LDDDPCGGSEACVTGPMFALIAAASILLCAAPATAEDAIGGDMVVTKGMKPWEGCGECHDLNGVAPNGHFPDLAGQKAAYLEKQLQDFRDGRRTNDHGQMGTSSRELTATTMREVVGYFSALPPPSPALRGEPGAAALARGRLIATRGIRAAQIPPCVNCHSADPKRAFLAPFLEAQPAAYLAKELHDFQQRKRSNDPDRVMEKIAPHLSQDDVDAVCAYLASQKRVPAAARLATGDGLVR
jgi:cytochrome c553